MKEITGQPLEGFVPIWTTRPPRQLAPDYSFPICKAGLYIRRKHNHKKPMCKLGQHKHEFKHKLKHKKRESFFLCLSLCFCCCVAHVQYCAKVMRANFVEIRPLFSRIFNEISNDISRSFFENSKHFRRKFVWSIEKSPRLTKF